MTLASPYFSRYCSIVIIFLLSAKHPCFVNQFSSRNSVESLVGGWIVKSALFLYIWPQFDVVQKRKLSFKRLKTVAAAVQTGFQTSGTNHQERVFQLLHIAPLSHEAYTGDESAIAPDQRIQVTLQRLPDILLQIWRVAVMTTVGAIGDGQCQADLLRYLCHGYCTLHIFKRRINRRLHRAWYSIHRRYDFHRQSPHSRQ